MRLKRIDINFNLKLEFSEPQALQAAGSTSPVVCAM